MAIRAKILFTYDARGRMVSTNEPDSRPAPRLFVGQTPGGHLVRFGATVPDDLARELEAVVQRHADDDGLAVPAPMRAALRAVLERHAPIKEEGGGPAYRFPASFA